MVRNSLTDGDELADRAVGQEDAAKQVLHALNNVEPDQSDFEEMVTTIVGDGREHIEFEQNEVAEGARHGGRGDLAELGEKMAKAKKAAPKRPHPATPSKPGCGRRRVPRRR